MSASRKLQRRQQGSPTGHLSKALQAIEQIKGLGETLNDFHAIGDAVRRASDDVAKVVREHDALKILVKDLSEELRIQREVNLRLIHGVSSTALDEVKAWEEDLRSKIKRETV